MIRSAADPWITVLIAVRSAGLRTRPVVILMPLIGRRRPRIVSTRPLAWAPSEGPGDEPSTPAYSWKYASMNAAASAWVMPSRLREPVRGQPVDHAEIDRLGDPPHGFVDRRLGDPEDPRGDGRVDVVVRGKGPAQGRIVGIMGQNPQLDLRVVGRQERPARAARDERLADLAPVLGPDRDVLEVGVARAEPAGRRHALVERGVDPAVRGMHEPGQRVEIGALELGKLAMLR